MTAGVCGQLGIYSDKNQDNPLFFTDTNCKTPRRRPAGEVSIFLVDSPCGQSWGESPPAAGTAGAAAELERLRERMAQLKLAYGSGRTRVIMVPNLKPKTVAGMAAALSKISALV